MFGYLIADRANLTEEEFVEYRSVYCGICSELRKNGLIRGTVSLSYDLVFLWMVLSSMYEPEETGGTDKCPLHPFSGTPVIINRFSEYVSQIGTILAYYKSLDDWHDDRNIVKYAVSGILADPFRKASAALPRQAEAIRASLDRISMMEESQSDDIDALCNSFGELLGEVFVFDEGDYWAQHLRRLGNAVGRYLYLLDAVLDLEEDIRRGRYNPLCQNEMNTFEWQKNAIDLFLGDISEIYSYLPVVKYSAVLNSIIYSGITEKYRKYCEQRSNGETDVP